MPAPDSAARGISRADHWERLPMENSRWLRPLAVIMLVSMVTQAFGRLTFPVLLPSMVADYVGNYSAAGVSTAVNLAGYVVGTCLAMALVRLIDSLRLIRVGVILVIGSMALIAVSSDLALLDVAQFVAGLGCAAGWLGCGSVADDLSPSGRKGLAFGLMFAGVGVGIASIGVIVEVVRSVFGPSEWRPVWWSECFIGAIALTFLYLCLRPTGPTGAPSASGTRPLPRHVVRLVGLVCVGYALFGLAHATYTTFLTATLHDDRHFSIGTAALLYSLLGITDIIGGALFGRASDALGRKPLLVGGYALMLYCAVSVCYGPNLLGGLSPLFYGLVMSGVPTVVTAYVYGSVPPDATRVAYGAITLAVGVGNLAGPLTGGYLADASGSFETTYDMVALAAIGAAAATLVSLRFGHRQDAEVPVPEPL